MKFSLLAALGIVSAVQAHMEMTFPPPFRSKYNQYTTDIDYSMTSPLEASGANFPCKGYHSLYDTPQGRAVATWSPGQTVNFTLTGSATHNGGSCQASFSYDRGKTWTVVHSYIGQCPLKSTWSLTLPNDTPAGDALFAWSWFNNLGNREMYMNCAHVVIKGGVTNEARAPAETLPGNNGNAGQTVPRSPSDPYRSRPAMFVANVGNGCGTVETYDLDFPQPGPDVDRASKKTQPPTGTCAKKRSVLYRA
ncbi:hypothetical protein VHEMI01914 [[Torrubiella] hemipterigena]|uniref:Extracellular protein n=1 Tax=[Torrubiella] hemipterigena TaxID=1531966 RepID=A0A0A1T8V4_9HYPO|nr:hypothetical protein VHEMI01914 [[Torrubiella] hemipterigena]